MPSFDAPEFKGVTNDAERCTLYYTAAAQHDLYTKSWPKRKEMQRHKATRRGML